MCDLRVSLSTFHCLNKTAVAVVLTPGCEKRNSRFAHIYISDKKKQKTKKSSTLTKHLKVCCDINSRVTFDVILTPE